MSPGTRHLAALQQSEEISKPGVADEQCIPAGIPDHRTGDEDRRHDPGPLPPPRFHHRGPRIGEPGRDRGGRRLIHRTLEVPVDMHLAQLLARQRRLRPFHLRPIEAGGERRDRLGADVFMEQLAEDLERAIKPVRL